MTAPARTFDSTAGTTTRRTTAELTALDSDAVGRDVGLLVLRVGFGILFAGHGAQKLFGWWGAPDFDGVAAGFAQIGYSPGRFFGYLGSGTEVVAGLLLVLGLLTPLACAAVIGVMVNVIFGVSWSAGLYGQNGFELPLMFALAAAAIAFTGPGRLSLDRSRRWAEGGLRPGLAGVGVGVVSGLIVLLGFKG